MASPCKKMKTMSAALHSASRLDAATGCGAGDTQPWVKQEDTLQEEENIRIKKEDLDQEFALTHNTAECGAGVTQVWVKQEDTLQEEDIEIKTEDLDQELALTHDTAVPLYRCEWLDAPAGLCSAHQSSLDRMRPRVTSISMAMRRLSQDDIYDCLAECDTASDGEESDHPTLIMKDEEAALLEVMDDLPERESSEEEQWQERQRPSTSSDTFTTPSRKFYAGRKRKKTIFPRKVLSKKQKDSLDDNEADDEIMDDPEAVSEPPDSDGKVPVTLPNIDVHDSEGSSDHQQWASTLPQAAPAPGDPSAMPAPTFDTSSDSSFLSSSQIKSRKMARGPTRDAIWTKLKQFAKDKVLAKDGSIWHRKPNPKLPRMSGTQQTAPGHLEPTTRDKQSPSQLFEMFIPDIAITSIEYYTCKKMDTLRTAYKEDNATTSPVTLMEMKAFLGILIASGLKGDNHAGVDNMWSTFHGCPLYRATMTNRRFAFLLRALRFDNAKTRKQRLMDDKLAPIRALWDTCVAACRRAYVPGPHLTVDKQLIPFRGRCSFLMYITHKPANYRLGLKIVMVCDADTHYMCNAIPYVGKGSVTLPQGTATLGEYYLTELTKPYGGQWRTVTSDTWFSTLAAALALRKNKMEFVGTIKKEPYLPEKIHETKLDVGDSVALYNYDKHVTLLCHRDSKDSKVQLLSTIHHQPTVVENKKTDIQMFYNATKGGVDTFDQLTQHTSCSRITNRWPLCFFYGMLNLVFTNCYILHQVENRGKKINTRFQYGMQMVEELCKPWAMHRLAMSSLTRELRMLIGSVYQVVSDLPSPVQAEGAQGNITRSRCAYCPRAANAKTKVVCKQCKKKVCARHYVTLCTICHQ